MIPLSGLNGYPQADPDEIRRALHIIHGPEAIFELRILGVDTGNPKKVNRFGFFSNIDDAVREASGYTKNADGVYLTVNPICPDLLSRSPNRTRPCAKDLGTHDSDVLRRRWLLIDLDPVRPAHTSATEVEREASEKRMEEIHEFLDSVGFPEPVMADSGNGSHLLHCVDLPAEDGGLIHRLLRALDRRFSDSTVKVDTTVHNPSRIWKLYGTIARKGAHTAERPHRIARITNLPQELNLVSEELIAAATEEAATPPQSRTLTRTRQSTTSSDARSSGFDVDAWICRNGLSLQGPSIWTDPEGNAGRRWEFDVCPWNPEHCDRSAYIVQFASGPIAAGCHHSGCSSRSWSDLRALVEFRSPIRISQDDHEEESTEEQIVFPPNAWRGVFGQYRDLMAPSSEAPVAFLWSGCAGSLSFLTGRTVWLDWGVSRMYPLIFSCVVGETANSRKSTTLDEAVSTIATPLMELLGKTWKHPGAIIVGSGSGEGFAEALSVNDIDEATHGKRALIVIHELGALLEKIGRDQAGNMVDFILAAHDARPNWSHRTRSAGGSPLKLTNAVGVFLCASTEAWLAKTLRESLIRAGFMNRFLWISGPRGEPIPLRPSVPPGRVHSFQEDLFNTLKAVEGRSCTFTPEAREMWNDRYRKEYHRKTESDLADAASARSDVLALRTAMLFAVAEKTTVIEVSHIESAWSVVEHSRAVSDRIVARMSDHGIKNAEIRVLAAIRRFIETKGPVFTRGQIWQRVKGNHGMLAETFNRVFRALVEAGSLTSAGDGSYILST